MSDRCFIQGEFYLQRQKCNEESWQISKHVLTKLQVKVYSEVLKIQAQAFWTFCFCWILQNFNYFFIQFEVFVTFSKINNQLVKF